MLRPKYAGEVSDNEDERSEESDLNEDDAHVSSSRQYQPDFEAVRANAGLCGLSSQYLYY